MSTKEKGGNRRILIIDDNESIHRDIRKILANQPTTKDVDEATALFLGTEYARPELSLEFELTSAFQGKEGLLAVEESLASELPFAAAFVDMQMPPGWDGLETISRIWERDPEVQIVICTAYSDYSWREMASRLGRPDGVLVLKKPFDPIEARQLAYALSEKWNLLHRQRLQQEELQSLNERLETEIVKRRRVEDQLHRAALHDELTNLPNRALLCDRVDRCLRRSKRERDYQYAVMLIDMGDLEDVIARLGHPAGDRMLIEVARRLGACIRASDSVARLADGTAARLGEDEFVILLDSLNQSDDIRIVAQRVLEGLSEPFRIDGQTLRVTAAIGMAQGQPFYHDPEEILRDANTAVTVAKELGESRVVLFETAMRERTVAGSRLKDELRRAIELCSIHVQYQPIVSLEDETIVGFEALARWNHPEHGPIPPSEFVPVAEQAGLVVPLEDLVLREACRQASKWSASLASLPLSISVFASSRQFMADGFVDKVERVLLESGLDRELLHLELTEPMIAEEEQWIRILEQLRLKRVTLRLGDVGMGHSSLNHLDRQPLSAVKLDRTWVAEVVDDEAHAEAIKAVIEMAHRSSLKVIADGIETVEQVARLRELGCDFGSGYLFSRPIDAESVHGMLLAASDQRLSA